MILRALFAGCIPFGHGNRLWARDANGVMRQCCEDCGHNLPILETPVIVGPAHTPEEVRGAPQHTKVKTQATRSKVIGGRFQ